MLCGWTICHHCTLYLPQTTPLLSVLTLVKHETLNTIFCTLLHTNSLWLLWTLWCHLCGLVWASTCMALAHSVQTQNNSNVTTAIDWVIPAQGSSKREVGNKRRWLQQSPVSSPSPLKQMRRVLVCEKIGSAELATMLFWCSGVAATLFFVTANKHPCHFFYTNALAELHAALQMHYSNIKQDVTYHVGNVA